MLPHEDFTAQLTGFSLYTLSASPWYFQLVYHLGIAAALAVMLGVGGRPGLALHWALLWSVYQRQPGLLDGGDNLAYVVIPFLLLTRCYDRFSLPTGLASRLTRRLPGHLRAMSVPFHNLGVLMVAAQICLVYVVSGLYKVMGEEWQDGTALFYIMRVAEFELPGWSHLVYENDVLVVLGTYGTVAFLVYFPMGVLVSAAAPLGGHRIHLLPPVDRVLHGADRLRPDDDRLRSGLPVRRSRPCCAVGPGQACQAPDVPGGHRIGRPLGGGTTERGARSEDDRTRSRTRLTDRSDGQHAHPALPAGRCRYGRPGRARP